MKSLMITKSTEIDSLFNRLISLIEDSRPISFSYLPTHYDGNGLTIKTSNDGKYFTTKYESDGNKIEILSIKLSESSDWMVLEVNRYKNDQFVESFCKHFVEYPT